MLVNGDGSNDGYVLLHLRGTWGAVCGASYSWDTRRQWTTANAQVVCRQLGLPWEGATARTGPLGSVTSTTVTVSSSPVTAGVNCSGGEAQLADCPMYWGGIPSGWDCSYNVAGMNGSMDGLESL